MYPNNYKLYKTLDSTNQEAKRLSLLNHPETWVLALKQTRGRGRNGKVWLTGTNGFAASLLYYPKISFSEMILRSYVAGIALYDCVCKIGVSKNLLTLKWPNDLLLEGQKVAGILVETFTRGDKASAPLIIGFGVNLGSCPNRDDLEKDAIIPGSLEHSGLCIPKPEQFLTMLMPIYQYWDSYLITHGFKRLRQEFLNRTFPIGQQIRVRKVNGAITGLFSGIRTDGALKLVSSSGTVFVTAGDVFLIGE